MRAFTRFISTRTSPLTLKPYSAASAGDMGRVRAGNHRLGRNAARIHTGTAKLVTFDDGNGLARSRKPRSQGRACLARPDDDCVEVLHWQLVGTFDVEFALFGRFFGRLRRFGARQCRRRTSPTNGASEPSVRTRHDAARSRAKALSASRRPNC